MIAQIDRKTLIAATRYALEASDKTFDCVVMSDSTGAAIIATNGHRIHRARINAGATSQPIYYELDAKTLRANLAALNKTATEAKRAREALDTTNTGKTRVTVNLSKDAPAPVLDVPGTITLYDLVGELEPATIMPRPVRFFAELDATAGARLEVRDVRQLKQCAAFMAHANTEGGARVEFTTTDEDNARYLDWHYIAKDAHGLTDYRSGILADGDTIPAPVALDPEYWHDAIKAADSAVTVTFNDPGKPVMVSYRRDGFAADALIMPLVPVEPETVEPVEETPAPAPVETVERPETVEAAPAAPVALEMPAPVLAVLERYGFKLHTFYDRPDIRWYHAYSPKMSDDRSYQMHVTYTVDTFRDGRVCYFVNFERHSATCYFMHRIDAETGALENWAGDRSQFSKDACTYQDELTAAIVAAITGAADDVAPVEQPDTLEETPAPVEYVYNVHHTRMEPVTLDVDTIAAAIVASGRAPVHVLGDVENLMRSTRKYSPRAIELNAIYAAAQSLRNAAPVLEDAPAIAETVEQPAPDALDTVADMLEDPAPVAPDVAAIMDSVPFADIQVSPVAIVAGRYGLSDIERHDTIDALEQPLTVTTYKSDTLTLVETPHTVRAWNGKRRGRHHAGIKRARRDGWMPYESLDTTDAGRIIADCLEVMRAGEQSPAPQPVNNHSIVKARHNPAPATMYAPVSGGSQELEQDNPLDVSADARGYGLEAMSAEEGAAIARRIVEQARALSCDHARRGNHRFCPDCGADRYPSAPAPVNTGAMHGPAMPFSIKWAIIDRTRFLDDMPAPGADYTIATEAGAIIAQVAHHDLTDPAPVDAASCTRCAERPAIARDVCARCLAIVAPDLAQTVVYLSHSAEDGTIAAGETRPYKDILKAYGWKWSRTTSAWYVPRSRDTAPNMAKIDATAEALRAAGALVSVNVDDAAPDPGAAETRQRERIAAATAELAPCQHETPDALAAAILAAHPLDVERARRAHTWNSFEPDTRAAGHVADYAAEITRAVSGLWPLAETPEQRAILADRLDTFAAQYHKRYTAWLDALSRTASTMVTGRGNFNYRRNNKALDVEHRRLDELIEWTPAALKRIHRAILDARTPEQRDDAAYEAIRKEIDRDLTTIAEIEAGKTHYNKQAFTTSIVGRIERAHQRGEHDAVRRALAYLDAEQQRRGIKGITKRHSVWKLAEPAVPAISGGSQENDTMPITRKTIDAFWSQCGEGTRMECLANTYNHKAPGTVGTITKPGKSTMRLTLADGKHLWLKPQSNVSDVVALSDDTITYRIGHDKNTEHTATWKRISA